MKFVGEKKLVGSFPKRKFFFDIFIVTVKERG